MIGNHLRFYFIRIFIVFSVILFFVQNVETGFAQQDDRTTVRVDGSALFRVGPIDEMDSRERAAQIERRIQNLLENPEAITPAVIEVSQADPSRRIISVASVPVVFITEEDAQDNLLSVDDLALQWRQAIDDTLRRGADRRLGPGGRIAAEIRGSIETAFGSLFESAITVIPRIIAVMLVLLLFWVIIAVIRWLTRLLFRRFSGDVTMENLIKQTTSFVIWIIAIIVAVDALGFDPQVVITSLGLTSVALGFALKDILSNYVSGILILGFRPFMIGDQIVVGETEGNVERIDLRATHIRTYDGRLILVPNGELFTSRVTNNTASPIRRASVTLPVRYDADLRKAAEVIISTVMSTPGVLQDPVPSVRVRELSADYILVEARFWTDSRRSDYLLTSSTVRASLVQALRNAGFRLPEPDSFSVEIENTTSHEE
jgi:small conductance mechanosensitive channel